MANVFRGHAAYNTEWLYIFHNYGARSDNGAIANFYACAQNSARSNPHIVANFSDWHLVEEWLIDYDRIRLTAVGVKHGMC